MAFSAGYSPQMKMLSAADQQAIIDDYANSPNADGGVPTLNMRVGGRQVSGPVFEGDDAVSGATVGPLTRTQVQQMLPEQVDTPTAPPAGALSHVAQAAANQPPDIAEMLKQYMPQDDSQSRYLTLAAGFLAPTKTGSFGEQLGNVASMMQQQRSEQEKMRAQYVPLIMQQVAAQQAREEQAKYRLEAQQQAQAAAAQAAQQAQQARADQAAMQQRSMDERAAADRVSREERSAADRLTREHITSLRPGPDVPKTKPGEMWDTASQTIKVVPGSDLERNQKSAHAKDFGTMQSTVSSMNASIDKVAEILDPKNEAAFNSNFGGYNALATQYLPGDTADMRKKIDALKSDLKMAGLNVIRSGGSIGAMTEKEWPIVESMIARIDPVLGEDAARQELRKVQAHMERIRDNAATLYETEWKGSPHHASLAAKPAAGAPVQNAPTADAVAAEIARRKGGK